MDFSTPSIRLTDRCKHRELRQCETHYRRISASPNLPAGPSHNIADDLLNVRRGSIRGVPSSPRARPAISFSMLLYFDAVGSLKSASLASVLVLTAPMFTVTTVTPKGVNSRRRASVIGVMAALDPA